AGTAGTALLSGAFAGDRREICRSVPAHRADQGRGSDRRLGQDPGAPLRIRCDVRPADAQDPALMPCTAFASERAAAAAAEPASCRGQAASAGSLSHWAAETVHSLPVT